MIYEYKCTKCDSTWDEIRSVKDRDKTTKCPDCSGLGKHQLSAVSFYFVDKIADGIRRASSNLR